MYIAVSPPEGIPAAAGPIPDRTCPSVELEVYSLYDGRLRPLGRRKVSNVSRWPISPGDLVFLDPCADGSFGVAGASVEL